MDIKKVCLCIVVCGRDTNETIGPILKNIFYTCSWVQNLSRIRLWATSLETFQNGKHFTSFKNNMTWMAYDLCKQITPKAKHCHIFSVLLTYHWTLPNLAWGAIYLLLPTSPHQYNQHHLVFINNTVKNHKNMFFKGSGPKTWLIWSKQSIMLESCRKNFPPYAVSSSF